jgi:hypothetical protein
MSSRPPALLVLVFLVFTLSSCASNMHLIQTRSGKGYIARLEPELRSETGVYIFEDMDRMLVMVPASEIMEIRPIDALEARKLGESVFFIPSAGLSE